MRRLDQMSQFITSSLHEIGLDIFKHEFILSKVKACVIIVIRKGKTNSLDHNIAEQKQSNFKQTPQ